MWLEYLSFAQLAAIVIVAALSATRTPVLRRSRSGFLASRRSGDEADVAAIHSGTVRPLHDAEQSSDRKPQMTALSPKGTFQYPPTDVPRRMAN